MIRWIIWSAPLAVLIGTIVYKITLDIPPGWWTVLLALAAGINIAAMAQMLTKKLTVLGTEEETMINEAKEGRSE
jgi:hypothetical protein